MAYLLGKDCKVYLKDTLMAAPAGAKPTAAEIKTAFTGATEMTLITDVTVDSSTESVDITTRGSTSTEEAIVSINYSVKFTARFDDADASFTTLITKYNDRLPVAVAALSGALNVIGKQGPAGNWNIKTFSRKEGLKDVVTVDVELTSNSYVSYYKVATV